jgi:hypothetical protein
MLERCISRKNEKKREAKSVREEEKTSLPKSSAEA